MRSREQIIAFQIASDLERLIKRVEREKWPHVSDKLKAARPLLLSKMFLEDRKDWS